MRQQALQDSWSARELYLDLMKRCLINSIYEDPGIIPKSDRSEVNEDARRRGLDWPTRAMTMIGSERLENIQCCVEDVIRNRVAGDLIETGVWRGGATIFMRAILRAWDVRDRRVWVADSFAGLPAPSPDSAPDEHCDDLHQYQHLAVSLEEVQENFSRFGLLDDQVAFLKGWFCDTLPSAPIAQLAVIRFDGDMNIGLFQHGHVGCRKRSAFQPRVRGWVDLCLDPLGPNQRLDLDPIDRCGSDAGNKLVLDRMFGLSKPCLKSGEPRICGFS